MVLVILALLAGMASLGFGRSVQQRLDNTAQQAQLWLQQVQDTAVFTSSVWGVRVEKDSMQAYVWQDDGSWLTTTDIENFAVPKQIILSMALQVKEKEPQITLLPTGQIVPAADILLEDSEYQIRLDWKESYQIQLLR